MSLLSVVFAQQKPNDSTNMSNDTTDKSSRTIIIVAAVIGTLILVGIIFDLVIRRKNLRKKSVDPEKTVDCGEIGRAYGFPPGEPQQAQQLQRY
ncbi:hypothetical protein [Parasitella parasitica]|uniref:Uncharacterized protein n=1 Tax=Parasitella parasitica TaxID=35722 RepID=A0A0B7NUU1_9FUNG|nr:hypothetical protein [Parasitella parasitica]